MLIIAHLLPGGGLQGIEPRKGIATNAVLEWEYNEVSVQLQGIEPRKGIDTVLPVKRPLDLAGLRSTP